MTKPEPAISDREKVNAPEPLNLFSLRELEHRLGFSREFLRTIAKDSPTYYHPFDLPKEPRPFAKPKQEPKTKLRRIDRPTGALCGDVAPSDTDKYVATLKGRIVHLATINPPQAAPFQAELARILN